ncbi:MAG: ornithine cyclodeaminase family protein [bacterium]
MNSNPLPQELFSRKTIQSALSLEDVISTVRRAFELYSQDEVQMPSKNYVYFEGYNGDLRTMTAYIPSFDTATVKIVNSHPDNPKKHSLPSVMAFLATVDPETGYPQSLLDATEITAQRTAAASAVATQRLTPTDAETLGIIGAGAQAPYQVQGQCSVRNIEHVLIYDRDHKRSKQLCQQLKERFECCSFEVSPSLEELIESSQIINSLTPTREPLVSSMSTLNRSPALHINAMGADGSGKQEWPVEFLTDVNIVIDQWEQASHSGEIHSAVGQGVITRSDVVELGDTLTGNTETNLRENPSLFDSTGLGIQDTAGAHAFLKDNPEPDQTFTFFNA